MTGARRKRRHRDLHPIAQELQALGEELDGIYRRVSALEAAIRAQQPIPSPPRREPFTRRFARLFRGAK